MFGALDGFGFEFSDEGIPPPERSEAEEMEEWDAEDTSDESWEDSIPYDSEDT